MNAETIPQVRAYIVEQQSLRMSMRVALSRARADGLRIRTDDFATLWRDERRKRDGDGNRG
jgi:hypothetical protein